MFVWIARSRFADVLSLYTASGSAKTRAIGNLAPLAMFGVACGCVRVAKYAPAVTVARKVVVRKKEWVLPIDRMG